MAIIRFACPALDQDGPVRISAVDLNALAGRDSELGRVQFPAKLPAEQAQHDPLSVTLPT